MAEFDNFKKKLLTVSLNLKDLNIFKKHISFQHDIIFMNLWNSLNLYLEVQKKSKMLINEIENPSNHLYHYEKVRYRLLVTTKVGNLTNLNQIQILNYLKEIDVDFNNSVQRVGENIKISKNKINLLKEKIKVIEKDFNLFDKNLKDEIKSISHE